MSRRLHDGSLTEIEVAWSDPFGHAAGKRIPARQFLERAHHGFAFCEAALGWNTGGTVIDGLRLTNWDSGYPDVRAVPDFSTFEPLPWRAAVGHVISDIARPDGSPSLLDPRGALRRVITRLASLGFTAKVGVEFEFYLLNSDGSPIQTEIHAYRRYTPDSFAPDTVNWSRDNRSAAVRSLVEDPPSATRIELRSGASDANPYWLNASALAAVERLFDTGGASATARALNLDRHWRNVRTVATHNPLAYKAHAAGNYAVKGVWPAANGYF
ncbi:hypothetical protein ACXDF8_04660 [Mycolicibacterium sp. CBM1]